MSAFPGWSFLRAGGACGDLIAAAPWETSPLGPIDGWPAALRATLANLLRTRQPMLLFWGPELIQFYNDAFVPSFGRGKHPGALGQPARVSWADAWPVVGAQLEAVAARGEAFFHEDAPVPIYRNGRMEEVFWTYSYSPAHDDAGAIAGVLVVVTETTGRVLAGRRLDALARLGVPLAAAGTADDVDLALAGAARALPSDLPRLVVRRDGAAWGAIGPRGGAAIEGALAGGVASAVVDLPASEISAAADGAGGGGGGDVAARAFAARLADGAVLAVGLNPRLPFDDAYQSFLAQMVDQAIAALRRVEAQLRVEQASRAKDEFLAMLGHELRNPLAPIVSALELMKAGAPVGVDQRATIERHVHHVVRLVDDLLDVARLTRGKLTLERAPIDLAEVVRDAVEATAPLFRQREQRVATTSSAGHLVLGDRGRLVQVASNLLTNAARYSPLGSRTDVELTRAGDDVVLCVRDRGRGVAPELLPRLFELFVQGERGPDRAEGGLGIGLALVRNLVALHGGSVEATSAGPDLGSTFTVRLPALDAAALPAAPPSAAAPSVRTRGTARPRRVLIVDDNEDAAHLLAALARAHGHVVEVRHDAREVLAIGPGYEPEVAVLDIGLPGIDGHELGARLRTIWPACALIALSGYGQEQDRRRSLEIGFAAHLVKPIAVESLLALIDEPAGAHGSDVPASG